MTQCQSEQAEMRAEYESKRIAPVYADPEHTMIVSLAMMLHNGWRIERVDGRSVLMRGDEVR